MFKKVLGLLCALFLFFVIGVVYADETGSIVSIPSHEATAVQEQIIGKQEKDLVAKTGATIESGNSKILQKCTDDGKIEFNSISFSNATDRSKKDAVKELTELFRNSTISDQTQRKIFYDLGEINPEIGAMLIPVIFDSTSADLFTAYKWLFPFLQVIRVVFGVGAIGIILFLILSTIIDLAYIGLPFGLTSIRESSSNRDGRGSDRPWGVSFDAISTIKEIEGDIGQSSGKYRNAYALYFRRRAVTYIILAICVLYLVVGELGGLIASLMNLGSGIVK